MRKASDDNDREQTNIESWKAEKSLILFIKYVAPIIDWAYFMNHSGPA